MVQNKDLLEQVFRVKEEVQLNKHKNLGASSDDKLRKEIIRLYHEQGALLDEIFSGPLKDIVMPWKYSEPDVQLAYYREQSIQRTGSQ